MKRTTATLLSLATVVMVIGVIAGPAVAKTDYNSNGSTDGGATLTTPAPQSSAGEVGYRSVNSITGAEQTVPQATPSVIHASGFDWEDAMVGAVGALIVALISFASVLVVRRRGHRPAASGA